MRGRAAIGDGMGRKVVSLRSRAEGVGEPGNPEERNLLRRPLALTECIADTRAPEKRRPSADGLQRPLRRFFLPPSPSCRLWPGPKTRSLSAIQSAWPLFPLFHVEGKLL